MSFSLRKAASRAAIFDNSAAIISTPTVNFVDADSHDDTDIHPADDDDEDRDTTWLFIYMYRLLTPNVRSCLAGSEFSSNDADTKTSRFYHTKHPQNETTQVHVNIYRHDNNTQYSLNPATNDSSSI